MDALHAPWRIDYILSPKPPLADGDASIFTKIARSSDDVTNLVVMREKTCFAVLNAYPYVGGHLMAVPYRQVADLTSLTEEELTDLFKLTCRCQRVLTKVMKPHGFNVGVNTGRCAGAGILEHVHVHIVPRWTGDTNFMPIIAGATVLPEALIEVGNRIRAAAQEE